MANPTRIADLVSGSEEVFNDYVIEAIMGKSSFAKSNVMQAVSALVPTKGKFIHFPFWNGLEGDDQVLSDNAGLVNTAITSGEQIAAILGRGNKWTINDLTTAIAGSGDPLRLLANLQADYWVRRIDVTGVNVMVGAAAGIESDNAGLIINDISAEVGALSNITAKGSYDTMGLLGEYAGDVGVVAMKSAVHTYLNGIDATQTLYPTSASVPVETYLGKQIIINDNLPESAGVFQTYFCKAGALGFADGTDPMATAEFDRDITTGDNVMTSRRRFVIHAAGSKLDITAAEVAEASTNALGYSNATLADATVWGAAFTDLNKFGIRVLSHKINQ